MTALEKELQTTGEELPTVQSFLDTKCERVERYQDASPWSAFKAALAAHLGLGMSDAAAVNQALTRAGFKSHPACSKRVPLDRQGAWRLK